ncbi:uncharacterized protein [Chelonus insularis]|uniref:uncharacterized protein n=1 Tax=Chelonus insularis TaxID=460826 RepID=UPI00158BDF27|nr:uncharacterized protein LOC118073322 [Chelonus insularis]
MIGKNDQTDSDKTTRMKIITEKKQVLEENAAKVRAQVTNCFDDLRNSLKSREKQLLRQIEAIHNQQLSIIQSNWELVGTEPSITVNLDEVKNFQDIISKLGKIELPDKESLIVKNLDPYKVQEYEDANKDIVNFDKSLNIHQSETNVIIKLSNLQYKRDSMSPSNHSDFSDLKISFPSNSINVTNDSELKTKNIISPNLRSQKKLNETDNNHCPLSCSQDSTLIIPHPSSDNVNNSILNGSLCSSETKVENSENEITPLSSPVFIEQNEQESNGNSLDNFKDSVDEFINVNGDVNNAQEKNSTDEHPKQIQQWLQQILIESETEPPVQEVGSFTEISKFHNESPLGT